MEPVSLGKWEEPKDSLGKRPWRRRKLGRLSRQCRWFLLRHWGQEWKGAQPVP